MSFVTCHDIPGTAGDSKRNEPVFGFSRLHGCQRFRFLHPNRNAPDPIHEGIDLRIRIVIKCTQAGIAEDSFNFCEYIRREEEVETFTLQEFDYLGKLTVWGNESADQKIGIEHNFHTLRRRPFRSKLFAHFLLGFQDNFHQRIGIHIFILRLHFLDNLEEAGAILSPAL